MTQTHSPSTAVPPLFPFAAITGQPELRLALLLAAIDPQIGGVLVQGPRGTAKSTAARALAELMPGAPFVTLPLGATLEHVVGTLDLRQALAGRDVQFAPGLLARAHGGVLYVDEINLLADALVDVLLDVAASGVNVVERDGISHSHAARCVLVGTMNPEEGALRPQLLDRLGLCVHLQNVSDVQQRQAIVRARLSFDADPQAFRARHAEAQQQLAAQLARAAGRLRDGASLTWSDEVLQAASAHCIDAHVDGLRADIVLLRAARAYAAWMDAQEVLPEHVEAVAELVLVHRRKPHAAPPPQQQQQASAPIQKQVPAPEEQASGDSSQNADWGYMPPEPVALQRPDHVQPLVPRRAGALAPKKA